ncbi:MULTISPECIES: OsmC family protein [unclassified Burkholderia]|uniref:OsmC family protein n=1 Tax=unclassified Burkholderia TaxID=2613784 RepID=UPI002AB1A549|nr:MULTISPECIES: OsmC family protein [unclassified Burkholderia]
MAASEINLDLCWNNGFKGTGMVKGKNFGVQIGIPAALGGSGEGANPKELLASSAAACFIATLTAILENRKIPVQHLAITTHSVETDDAFYIRHNTALTVGPAATDDDIAAIEALVTRADKACVIGNVLRKAGVLIEARLGTIDKTS